MRRIQVIGLGPGDGRFLTRQAWSLLTGATHLYLRTARHPAVADLPVELSWESFDAIYDNADSFDAVYAQIVQTLLAAAAEATVVYAVPGHPLMGESTVTQLLAAADTAGIGVEIVEGLSFVEPCLTAVSQDGMEGVQLFDAIAVAAKHYPPLNPDFPVLLGQVYNRMLAAELKMSLLRLYPPQHSVTLIFGAADGVGQTAEIPLYQLDHDNNVDHLTSLFIPPRVRPAGLPTLAETVATLRGPGGCPWDQEQTPQSLAPGLLEEVAELLDAIEADDEVNIAEELGDVFFHLVMQAQIAAEEEGFTLADVLSGIDEKLKRRHPHVWGDWQVADTAEVLVNWEKLKAEEKEQVPGSALDGVPRALPALARSQKIQKKARKVGFDWPDIAGVYEKVREEFRELQEAETDAHRLEELGDLFFVLVNIANWLELDAESALRRANEKFSRRFYAVEQLAAVRGIDMTASSLNELEALWLEVKKRLTANP